MLDLILILLHAPNGREITLNATAITSMQAAIQDKPNQVITNNANCVVSTTDGKFISTTETCEHIQRLINEAKAKSK